MTRALVSDDGTCRTYDVFDDAGALVGQDIEPAEQSSTNPVAVTVDPDAYTAAVAHVGAQTTIASLRAAVLAALNVLNPSS